MSKALDTHLAAIRSGFVTKANVIGIRRAINQAEREARGCSVLKSASTFEEVRTVEDAVDDLQPIVTGELHDSGLKVLRNPRYAKRWTDWQREAIAAIDHFKLVEFTRIGHRGEYAVPVYEVWAKIPPKGDALDGGSYQAFRFMNISWQSGGDGPEVLS